ncbi:hypothetical protein PIB30_100501 [Stylosanthes scabra]|uniref:Aminotransferase-like plant mobile domain-containing protein n=1 Tax=Stylosanthes scabra TaxID=79078 RepID=A0ABU6QYL6_9FABA|nr:hypothetical protein [Stylosanthes scabra]
MYVRFYHVDRVKRQFESEQAVPLDPVNLDGFLRASAKGNDKWWPDELAYWYGFWHNRRSRDHQIQIVPTRHPSWPTREYTDWWAVACRRRFLTQDRLLQDPRGFQLADDVPPVASQERDPVVLPRDAPARRRRARMQRLDIRRKGEGPGGDDEDEEAEYRRQEDIPEGDGDQDPGGDGPAPHNLDLDFFFGTDLELARFMEYGGGSGSGSRPQPSVGGGPSHRYGLLSDMYELFSCGEQKMDHIAHGYVASRATDYSVYRPSPPLQPHPDQSQPCQGFQYYQPSQQSFLHPYRSSSISYPRPIARRTTSHQRSRPISHLHGLSNITSPPSAITHRRRSLIARKPFPSYIKELFRQVNRIK